MKIVEITNEDSIYFGYVLELDRVVDVDDTKLYELKIPKYIPEYILSEMKPETLPFSEWEFKVIHNG